MCGFTFWNTAMTDDAGMDGWWLFDADAEW